MANKRRDDESRTERSRIDFTVSQLVASILDGGLVSYYYNSGAENLYDCMDDLETIGAEEMLMLLRAFNTLFGRRVPLDFAQRTVAYNALIDDAKAGAEMDRICKHDVTIAKLTRDLLEEYLARNRPSA